MFSNRWKTVALAATFAVIGVLFSSSMLYAQRDAGAKARGEFGTGFWNPQYRSRPSARVYVAPRATEEDRRGFSYEPSEKADEATAPATKDSGCSPRAAKSDDSRADVAQAPQTERRSFSYEPSMSSEGRAPSMRRSARSQKDPWLYPKSDPRRYSR